MTTAARYPIRAVSRMTGLSLDTLRAWERRYQAVVPLREDRGRAYSDRHVDRLKQLSALVAEGHAIGAIAALSDAALRRLHVKQASPPSGGARPGPDLAPLMRAMQQYDLPAVESIFNRHALLLPPSDLVFHVVLPVLREAGRRWESGTFRPAQEHLASSIIRGVLGGLLRSMPARAGATVMVFATPAGERHELGLLSGAVLAAAAGHHVIYLGPDLPSGDIVHAVATTKAAVLVLAATSHATPAGELRKLARVPARAELWIGGPQSPRLQQALGARVRRLATLEDLRHLVDRRAA